MHAGIAEGQIVLDIGFGSIEELLAIGALVGKKGSVLHYLSAGFARIAILASAARR